MALTPEQEKALAALEAERDAPEPRTTTGVKGVLHTLLDLASGVVPHISPERFAELHRQAEGNDGQDQAAAQPGDGPFGTETDPGPAE
jgi:hypothetical protein